MNRNLTAFIFARGGSKGVPRKNVRDLGGKPLIVHSIEKALGCDRVARVIVSTDDEEIAQVSEKYGALVPFIRPEELARDDSPEWKAWQHAIEFVNAAEELPNIDVFVSIPATAPMRSVEDIDRCIDTFLEGDADLVLTVRKSGQHPSFNMVTTDTNGYISLVQPPDRALHRRQDASPVFDVTTVAYIGNPDFIMQNSSAFQGRLKSVVVPAIRALDIDTELDFKFAEFLIENGTQDFTL